MRSARLADSLALAGIELARHRKNQDFFELSACLNGYAVNIGERPRYRFDQRQALPIGCCTIDLISSF
jgi:hypothetical protein